MHDDPTLLSLLYCPACEGDLRLERATERAPDGHVMRGELQCVACDGVYPIIEGIPRFVPEAQSAQVERTVKGFGFQWQRTASNFRGKEAEAAQTFLDFIHPVQPDYFRDKVVLDAGCGSGRFARLAQGFGAKAVVGVDLSDSVHEAFRTTRRHPNVLIVQADLFALPLRRRFDYAYSVGVLHHTPDPGGAFGAVARLVRPSGGMSGWVYARENNEWLVRYLNPVRRAVTSRLPHGLLLVIAYALSLPLFLVLRGVYVPAGRSPRLKWLRRILPYFDYLNYIGSRFGWREQAVIVFDHLVPAITEYIPRDEFESWFAQNNLRDVVITSRASNSWRGFGVARGAAHDR